MSARSTRIAAIAAALGGSLLASRSAFAAPQSSPARTAPHAGQMAQIVLTVPSFEGKTAELEIGLSRQQGKQWGPVRWRRVEVDDGKSARLDDVEPGVYRARFNLRVVDAHGERGPSVTLHAPASGTVRVEAGKAVRLALAK